MPPADRKLRLLVRHSAALKDAPLVEELLGHLRPLERFAGIDVWIDARIRAGGETRREIARAIDQADVALLLLSADFFASDGLVEQEVPRLLDRHRQGRLRVVPVLLRCCLWEAHPWLADLDPLPKDREPVASRQGVARDRVLTELAKEIARLAAPTMGSTTEKEHHESVQDWGRSKTGGDTYNISITNSTIGGLGAGQGVKVFGTTTTSSVPTPNQTPPQDTRPPSKVNPAGTPPEKMLVLKAVTNGTQLTQMLGGTQVGRFTHENCGTDEDAALVGDLLQECQDLLDLWDDLPARQRVESSRALSRHIENLIAAGWVVLAARTVERFKTGDGKLFTFEVANVHVARIESRNLFTAERSIAAPKDDTPLASVYLSYGDDDLPFARRLYDALEAAGVTVFFRHEHAVPGARHYRSARRSIREYEHVLLVSSERSLPAPNVMRELEELLLPPQAGGSQRLIKVVLDNFYHQGWNPRDTQIRLDVIAAEPVNLMGVEQNSNKFDEVVQELLVLLKR